MNDKSCGTNCVVRVDDNGVAKEHFFEPWVSPDAVAPGASLSGAFNFMPGVSVNGVIGGETVFNYKSGEITRFTVVGGGFNVGLVDWSGLTEELFDGRPYPNTSAGFSLTYSTIRNLEENWEFRGPFDYDTWTGASGLGLTGGNSHVPGDTQLVKPHSKTGGVTFGAGFSKSYGRVWYIPSITYNTRSGKFSLPIIPYILEIMQSG